VVVINLHFAQNNARFRFHGTGLLSGDREFEMDASMVLKRLYMCERREHDHWNSFNLLTRKLDSWGEKNLFEMADGTEEADFVRLNYCFQTQLDSIWYGSIAVDDVPKWKVNCKSLIIIIVFIHRR